MKQKNQFIILKNAVELTTMKQIQNDFTKAIFNRNDVEFIKQIRRNQVIPEFRLGIYRNNILQNLCRALEKTFPAIWKLVGKECADNLAYLFCHKEINLPVTNCLDDWGINFPRFLQGVDPIKHLIYLPDIAELEWLRHMSYRASNFRVLNPLKLQKKLELSEEIYLIFNPSVYLFSSPYSLKEIIELIESTDEKHNISLQQVKCYAVISRQYHRVVTHWISQDLFRFFFSIQNRLSLMQAYEIVYETNPDFDLLAALQFTLKNHLLWKIQFGLR